MVWSALMLTSPKCQQDQNRAEYMEFLYELYKRDEAEPGLRGTYTGLYEQHCWAISKGAAELQRREWHIAQDVVRRNMGLD